MAINEGRLKLADQAMRVDSDPFPVNMVDLGDRKVLVRPAQAESAPGKQVITADDLDAKHTSQFGGTSSPPAGTKRSRTFKPKNPRQDEWGTHEKRKESRFAKRARRPKPTFDALLAKYERKVAREEQARSSNSEPSRTSPIRQRGRIDQPRWQVLPRPAPAPAAPMTAPYPAPATWFGPPMAGPWPMYQAAPCPYPAWGGYGMWPPPFPAPGGYFYPEWAASQVAMGLPKSSVFDRLSWENRGHNHQHGRSVRMVEERTEDKRRSTITIGSMRMPYPPEVMQPGGVQMFGNRQASTSLAGTGQQSGTSAPADDSRQQGKNISTNKLGVGVISKTVQHVSSEMTNGSDIVRARKEWRPVHKPESKAALASSNLKQQAMAELIGSSAGIQDTNTSESKAATCTSVERSRAAGIEALKKRRDDPKNKGIEISSTASNPGQWCPSGVSRTQKRRLQRLKLQKEREEQAERIRDENFNALRPIPIPHKEQRGASDEHSSDDETDLLGDESPLIKDGSPPPQPMDIKMVFVLPSEFRAPEEEVA